MAGPSNGDATATHAHWRAREHCLGSCVRFVMRFADQASHEGANGVYWFQKFVSRVCPTDSLKAAERTGGYTADRRRKSVSLCVRVHQIRSGTPRSGDSRRASMASNTNCSRQDGARRKEECAACVVHCWPADAIRVVEHVGKRRQVAAAVFRVPDGSAECRVRRESHRVGRLNEIDVLAQHDVPHGALAVRIRASARPARKRS